MPSDPVDMLAVALQEARQGLAEVIIAYLST